MDKKQRRLIASFADKLNDDGTISESLYGISVKKGRDPIDQFIAAVEANYIDWDWNNKTFQQLLKQSYRNNPPASPDQLAAELKKSVQDDTLKQKLAAQLSSGMNVAAKQPPVAPAAPAQAASMGVKPAAGTKPGAKPAAGKQPINLAPGQTYEVTYQNFRGQTLVFKDLEFMHMSGAHAIFKRPRPANQPPGKWYRGRRNLTQQEAQQKMQNAQRSIAHIPNKTYRVHGGKQYLTARQIPKNWVKMTQNAQRDAQSAQRYYQATIDSVHRRLKAQTKIRIGLQMQRILAVK